MRLAYVFLAEAAEESNNRFFVYGGGMERVFCTGMPTAIASMAVIIKFALEDEELEETHSVQIVLRAPDGETGAPDLTASFGPLDRSLPKGRTAFHMVIATYRGLPIHQYGKYRFVVYVDDVEMGSTSFYADTSPVAACETGNEAEQAKEK